VSAPPRPPVRARPLLEGPGRTPEGAAVTALREWSFDELLHEGLSLIPAHAPDWTNHNPSDPGITLVELLAYVSEVMAYRLGRVTPQARLQFLRLLEGPQWPGWRQLKDGAAIDRALQATLGGMTQAECAVVAADFERLAVETARTHLGPDEPVRAFCAPGTGKRRAHVTVVLLPRRELEAASLQRLCAAVHDELIGRCLLTTRLHVVGPFHLHAAVGGRLALLPDARRSEVLDAIDSRLHDQFGPWGPEPLAPGTPVRLDRIVEVIDGTPGVDHVEDLAVTHMSPRGDELFDLGSRVGILLAVHSTVGVDARLGVLPRLGTGRLVIDESRRLAAIGLQPGELMHLRLAREELQVSGGTR
jgi:hypothetical protein